MDVFHFASCEIGLDTATEAVMGGGVGGVVNCWSDLTDSARYVLDLKH